MESGEHEGELKRLAAVEDAHIGIAGNAFRLASHDRPQVPLRRYHEHLDEIAAAIAAAEGYLEWAAGEAQRRDAASLLRGHKGMLN